MVITIEYAFVAVPKRFYSVDILENDKIFMYNLISFRVQYPTPGEWSMYILQQSIAGHLTDADWRNAGAR